MICPKCNSANVVPTDENNTVIGDYWVSYDCENCFSSFTITIKRANNSAHADSGKPADLQADSNAGNLSTSQAVA